MLALMHVLWRCGLTLSCSHEEAEHFVERTAMGNASKTPVDRVVATRWIVEHLEALTPNQLSQDPPTSMDLPFDRPDH